MRIIAGMARGFRLKSPPVEVRPTTDRIRESMFGTLGDLTGLRVADFFSGSGALGLEALSRGAAEVILVEHNRRHQRIIEANLEHVQKGVTASGGTGHGRVLRVDVMLAPLREPDFAPDWVLADPPYEPGEGEKGAADLLANANFHEWIGKGILVLEQARRSPLPLPANLTWRIIRQRDYGDTTLHYLANH